MKYLTRVRLINWHYFVDETIRFEGSTLITGDNGSGKSTILDAIQYALVADTHKVRFNVSAHDETKRDLRGYLRCKTGSENSNGLAAGFLRQGDFTSFIALEFYDSLKSEHFLLGAVVDSYAAGEYEARFFKVEGQALDNRLFLDGDRPRNIRGFRAALQDLKGRLYETSEPYRRDVLAKLGHLDSRFFSVLVKALSFRPITDIRKFVYDYVLDAEPVNIDVMRENLENYRHYGALVEQAKQKLVGLEAIGRLHGERADLENLIRVQSYIILKAERESFQDQINEAAVREGNLAGAISRGRAEVQALDKEISQVERTIGEIKIALASNSTQRLIEVLTGEIKELQDEYDRRQQAFGRLRETAKIEHETLKTLAGMARENSGLLGLSPGDFGEVGAASLLMPALSQAEPVAEAPGRLERLAVEIKSLRERAQTVRFGLAKHQGELDQEAQSLALEIERAKNRQWTYEEAVNGLREAIEREVRLNESPVRPAVLCELLEIRDETWRDAVEGYLNTQRFDLLVPPTAFDRSLTVYERRKRERNIHGVGLVNTGKVQAERAAPRPGSLAEEVETDDPFARAYADRLLGQVIKCQTEGELKNHRRAITPSCMTYRNHTARQINFAVYRTPFIGRKGLERQRRLKEERLAETRRELDQLGEQIRSCDQFLSLCGDRHDRYRLMAELWEQCQQLPGLATRLDGKKIELAEVDRTEVLALGARVEAGESRKKGLVDRQKDLLGQVGGWETDLRNLREELARLETSLASKSDELRDYAVHYPEESAAGAACYQEEIRARSNKKIAEGFQHNRSTLEPRRHEVMRKLALARQEYNDRYQFGGAVEADDNAAYDSEHRKLKESELPAYEEQIEKARRAAEEEFKEHFVHRLREQLETALREFQNLNRVLKDISFGQDRYHFDVRPAQEYKHFYQMVTDEFLMEGQTLFSQAFQDRHRATIDELFYLILDVPEDKQAENIQKFTDYRTYLEYDIRIDHANGEYSMFSRVCREKSGGETQTPYYVAIVASFLQLYRHRQNDNSIRLIMFDEAFNRMDVDRIENTLRFISQLGLQVILVAPINSCEIIAPHVRSTLLVMREGHDTWVLPYHQTLAEAAVDRVAGDQAAATGEA